MRWDLETDDERRTYLDDALWADSDAKGRLLVATIDGWIQVREPSADGWVVTWSHDLNGLEPDPAEASSWARTW